MFEKIFTIKLENCVGDVMDSQEVKCTSENISKEVIKLLQTEWDIINCGDVIRITHEV